MTSTVEAGWVSWSGYLCGVRVGAMRANAVQMQAIIHAQHSLWYGLRIISLSALHIWYTCIGSVEARTLWTHDVGTMRRWCVQLMSCVPVAE